VGFGDPQESSPKQQFSETATQNPTHSPSEAAHAARVLLLEARWSETTPLEAVRGFLPTLGDCFVFVMAAHENLHLGQVSAWRRVQGMGRV
jgi:hypothetical protein